MGGRTNKRITQPAELTRPVSDVDKWKHILRRGKPDYLDQPIEEFERPDGLMVTVFPPPNRQAYRSEVQRVAQRVFDDAASVEQKRKVLRSYASQFPHLAWDPESWLWPLWWEWRAREDRIAQRLLSALASGVRAPGAGWMDMQRFRAYRIEQARFALQRLRAHPEYPEYRDACREWLAGVRSPHEGIRRESARRFLAPFKRLQAWLSEHTGYKPTLRELLKLKLPGILRVAISKGFRVKESYLHRLH